MIEALNTVQDLASTSGVTEGTVAVTSGFKIMGDGGGGNFVWKTVATYGPRPASDGGIIIYNSDTTGWWEREFQFIDIRFFGGQANAIVLNDGAITAGANVLTSSSALFTSNDIGKVIYVNGAGPSVTQSVTFNSTLASTITAVSSSTQVTLANNATTTVSATPVTYGTDSTSAFTSINHYILSLTNKSAKIELQSGIYLTSNNNWLAGCRSVEIFGNGASIMCTYGVANLTGFATNNIALWMPSIFDSCNNNHYNGSLTPYKYGYLIQSTVSTSSAGANSITTVTPGDAGNFTVGSWALVYGFDHELIGGFPPDPRYYDYVKVTSVDSGTGIVTFDRSLNYSYNSDWPDLQVIAPNGITTGAPRIISANRNDIVGSDVFNIIENLIIKDLNFVPFPGWVGPVATDFRNGELAVYGYINAELTNVTCTGLYPGQGKNLTFKDCQFFETCEPDKVIDQLSFINCTINGISNGGGVNFIQMYGCTISGLFNLSPRYLDIDNCSFSTTAFGASNSLAAFGFNKGIEHLRLGTNVWNCDLPSRIALISSSNNIAFTVGAFVSDNEVTVTKANWIANKYGRQVLPGSIGYTSTNKRFIVSKVFIAPGDATNVHIQGDFSQVPVAGDVFKFIYVRRVTVEGRQHKVGANANSYQLFASEEVIPQIQYKRNDAGSDLKRILLSDQDIIQGSNINYRSVFGYATKLIINVIKPYTGTDTTALLKLSANPSGTFAQTIDLKTAGTRVAEVGRNAGSAGVDVLANIDTSYLQTLRFYWQGASSGTLAGDATVLPIFQIYLEAIELAR